MEWRNFTRWVVNFTQFLLQESENLLLNEWNSSGSLDIHSKTSDHWRHYQGSENRVKVYYWIFPVGGHWRGLGFSKGGTKILSWQGPPQKKKKKKKKILTLKKVLIFRRNKLTSKQKKKKRGGGGKVITSVGMGWGGKTIYKGMKTVK